MDLFQAMGVYVKVVETGSMTAAAQACGLSTTMVGNHLRALEQRLGVSLLKRTTRRQSLTEFGATYYQRCKDVLGLVDDSEQLAEQAQDDARGVLRLTAPAAFGAERLAPALAEFSLLYPLVQLEVVLTNQIIDPIEQNFDAAIRLGVIESSGLIARPLQDYTLNICAAPEYLQRRGIPADPEQLREHDCLAFSYPAGDDWQSVAKQWRLTGPQGEVVVPVSGPMAINSSPGLRQAALAGMGIVMLPDVVVGQDIAEGKLIALLNDYPPPSRPMHLVYTQDRYRLPKLRRFVDFVMARWGRTQAFTAP
jgi:DNA-binding transcriptional LysR family regulator